MVRQLVESFLCDTCGKPGERYTVHFPDGVLVMDRCAKHDRKILALREEQGTWNRPDPGRASFKVSTPDEIQAQRERHQGKG